MSKLKQLLSKEECELVLCNYLNKKKIDWLEYEIENFSDNLGGFSGQYYKVIVKYKHGEKEGNTRFFMKFLSKESAAASNLNKSINSYGKETFFFNYLQTEYLAENIDISFSPRGYLAESNKIVMEDLSVRDFKMRDNKSLFDLKHCEVVLESLSKFHSASISLQIKKGISFKEKFGDTLEEKIFSETDNLGTKWISCSLDGLFLLVENLGLNHAAEAVETIKSAFGRFIKTLSNWNEFTTILHGDLWNNNFLFDYDGSNPKNAVILDYQLLKLGPPGLDVLELIFTNTAKKLRDEHYNHLIDTYYISLRENLQKNGIEIENIFPKHKFLESLKYVEVGARIHAIAGRSIWCLDEETLKESLVNEEALVNFLFEDRSSCMLENFKSNKLFKDVIGEDVLDLINSLS